MDLMVPEVSYLVGLCQADGSLYRQSRNKGKLNIELRESDSDILEKLSKVIPCNCTISVRSRETNFSGGKLYASVTLSVYNHAFREWLGKYVPTGKKSMLIHSPEDDFSEFDYWRGIIDGDGSLGITQKGKGWPFLSLVTKSNMIASEFIEFIYRETFKKKISSRNKRDSVFNICVTKEDAQLLIKKLYYTDCLCIERKKIISREVLAWNRPKGMKRLFRKMWTQEEDDFILYHPIKESMEKLCRTRQSVALRLWRLRKKFKGKG